MRAFSAALLAAVMVTASACAGAPEGEGDDVEAGEDAFTSGVPVRVEHDFAPIELVLTKDFDDVFRERGYGVTSKLTPTVRFSLTGAKLVGQVTPGRTEHRRPTVLSADVATSAHYSASFDVALEVDGIGNVANLSEDDREDWEEKIIGGKPLVLAKDLLPADIPIAGPLFVHTHIDLAVACAVTEIDGHLGARTGAGFEGDIGFNIGYRRDHFPDNDSRFRFSTVPPNFQTQHTPFTLTTQPARVKGRCGLQPSITVLFERSIGAKVTVEPYVEIEATLSGANGLQIGQRYGVEGYAETDVQLLGHRLLRPFEFPLFSRPAGP
jgi:hypothetical protein